jgi:hypothetical protein
LVPSRESIKQRGSVRESERAHAQQEGVPVLSGQGRRPLMGRQAFSGKAEPIALSSDLPN